MRHNDAFTAFRIRAGRLPLPKFNRMEREFLGLMGRALSINKPDFRRFCETYGVDVAALGLDTPSAAVP